MINNIKNGILNNVQCGLQQNKKKIRINILNKTKLVSLLNTNCIISISKNLLKLNYTNGSQQIPNLKKNLNKFI